VSKNLNSLSEEWNKLPKNWYRIYQWRGIRGIGYTEWVADRIAEKIADIALLKDDLRERGFRQPKHAGLAQLKKGTEQKLTEDRIFRAIFNLGQLPLLGNVVDYQVPLKGSKGANHGKIDLLCSTPDAIFCVEAKRPTSSESIVKAILEAFVYTSLVAVRRITFGTEYKIQANLTLTPTVLVFAGASAYRKQLECWGQYPRLSRLIKVLDLELAKAGVGKIRFFVIHNNNSQVESCLKNTPQNNGYSRPSFKPEFVPNIVEWLNWTTSSIEISPNSSGKTSDKFTAAGRQTIGLTHHGNSLNGQFVTVLKSPTSNAILYSFSKAGQYDIDAGEYVHTFAVGTAPANTMVSIIGYH
jgi:hypothetical protein